MGLMPGHRAKQLAHTQMNTHQMCNADTLPSHVHKIEVVTSYWQLAQMIDQMQPVLVTKIKLKVLWLNHIRGSVLQLNYTGHSSAQ
jgi:hypothetical protein